MITETMWKMIDRCYIFYALSTQFATILLATRPRWYLYQSLISNMVSVLRGKGLLRSEDFAGLLPWAWVLPWAIAVTRLGITPDDAWKYHSIVFGGSVVFSFVDILIVDAVWAWALLKGRMSVPPVTGAKPD